MLSIHFALGKALEDIGDYCGGLRALAPGKRAEAPRDRLRRSGPPANFRSDRRTVRRQAAHSLSRSGRSLAGADLRPRHAPLRQHAGRADSGQPPASPRRRRTEESGSRRANGAATPAAGRFLFRSASGRSTPTACGDWGRLIWQACRHWPRARRGSPTRCRRISPTSA